MNFNDGTEADYEVKNLISHPHYDPKKRTNDIALIELKEDVNISTKVRPACLPNGIKVLMHQNVTAIGFGREK